MKTQTLDEFLSDLTAQGVPKVNLAFKCPMCGTIQSGADLIAAGAGKNWDEIEKYIGFSCIGRWTKKGPPPKVKGTQNGCNWTLGGLLRCHELTVITPDGQKNPRFEPCSPEQAKAHMTQTTAIKS